MCGRYYIDDETAQELERIIRRVNAGLAVRRGDIYPSQQAPVLFAQQREITVGGMQWGFSGFQGKSLIVNARCEGISDKKTFREAILHRRCIIPATGFYEWDRDKNKAAFQDRNREILYMAGIWKPVEDGARFVILTTRANTSVREVHERMPLLLEQKEIEQWILDADYPAPLLDRIPALLHRTQEYKQEQLPFIN